MKEKIFSVVKEDFKIEWFSGTGAGGQHRNKHQNSCRMTHVESGISKTGQSNRTRPANQKEAFNSIVQSKEFQNWLRIKVAHIVGDLDHIDNVVSEQMNPENLIVEEKVDGKWKKQENGEENGC